MVEGILWAVVAGVMLGLYALPEKYTREYKYENTWFFFFVIALIFFPIFTGLGLIHNLGSVLKSIPTNVLTTMIITSFLWGVGVQLWSKAIDYIGVALGFSIFIGAVIMVGSLLPFIVDGLPENNALITIILGLAVIMVGIIANGRAGILRQSEGTVRANLTDKTIKGISIALIGGLLATGFSLANAVGAKPITEAIVQQGNPQWMSSIAVMFIIYLSGALYVIPYFVVQLNRKKAWSNFKSPFLFRNLSLTFVMAFFNFFASALFAYAAYTLGNLGNSVGYAIYNTTSVLLAVIGGLLAKEWKGSSKKAITMLYVALISMILGVVIIAYGNSLQ